ncbi:hypothetical protein BAE44_0011636 [Dichanthelium oligosanthes]|uniref:40S ribosomal protein S18 n=1 Tax=Dichanthelium oligosanthes TaxID=888268 RepID=A0A1E5VQD6_9POAL|nr:hypothetical protein BAE44_0011636 [Dichanthelium oligosanthes]
MMAVVNPRQFKVLDWFLNKKDYKDGRVSHVVSNAIDMKLRDDLERLKRAQEDQGRPNLSTIQPVRSYIIHGRKSNHPTFDPRGRRSDL